MRCPIEAHGHLWLGTLFGRAVNTGAFDNLLNVGKGTHFRVHCHHRDVSNLKPAMAALNFSCQVHGTILEELLGVFEVVFLVLFDGGEVLSTEVIDDTIRFFGCVGRRW